MSKEKDTIIDAEFTETETNQDEGKDSSLIVPKRPNQPADPNQTTDLSQSRGYGRIVVYVLITLIVLALAALYIRGMYIAG